MEAEQQQYITMTWDNYEELKKLYDDAVANREPVLTFRGIQLVTGYAMYVLEWMRTGLPRRDAIMGWPTRQIDNAKS